LARAPIAHDAWAVGKLKATFITHGQASDPDSAAIKSAVIDATLNYSV
jgi:hypothetical protein